MATIPFLAACLFATVAQSTPKTGYVYSGGYGAGIGRPHQYTAEIGPVEGLGRVVQVVGGYYYSVALRADGSVASWGSGPDGQLGLGNKNKTTETPTVVSGLPAIRSVSGGATTVFAVSTTGEVYGWGVNDRGQLGPYTNKIFSPIKVPGLSDVVDVEAGFGNAVALKSDGTVWTWGAGGSGALGTGLTTDQRTPTQVPGLAGIKQISAGGSRVYALKADGTLWAWGNNVGGTLGVGSTASIVTSPAQVAGLSLVKEVSANTSHTLVLRDDGMVLSWGLNDLGQLGDPSKITTFPGTNSPSIVPGLSDIDHIGTGGSASYAVDRDGFAWVFGRGDGCLGVYKATSPTKVPGINKVLAVGGGYVHPLFLSNTSTPIWASATTGAIVPPYDQPTMRISVEGGTTSDLTVDLSTGGTLATLPRTATIPAGSSFVDVPITCGTETPDYTTLLLRATRGKVVATASLYLVPQVLAVSLSPEPQAGEIAGVSTTLNYRAPAGGVDVVLSTDHPEAIELPASIHIPAGEFGAVVQFPTKPSASNLLVTINANLGAKHARSQMYIKGNVLGTMAYSSPNVVGGNSIDLKLTLATVAPSGGTVVNLLTSSTDYFEIPSSVTVPAGSKEATVTITTAATRVPVDAVITAYVTGSYPKSKGFRIEAPTIEDAVLAKPAVLGGSTIKLNVTLTGVSAGETLTLTSGDPDVVVPASIVIPSGKKSVSVTVATATVTTNKNVAIKVKLRNQTVSAKLLVAATPPALKSLAIESTTIIGAASTTGTIEMVHAALAGGSTVTLTSSDPTVLTVPASVKVGFGNKTATFAVNAVRVQKTTSVVISATSAGVTKQITVTVVPKPKG